MTEDMKNEPFKKTNTDNPEGEVTNLGDLIEIVPPNFEVGQLYIPGRTQYANNVKAAFFTNSGQFVESFVWMPPKKYVKSFGDGDFHYGVYRKEGILLFLYKHAGGDWNVCPFNMNLVPETHRSEIKADDDGRLPIKGVLVDGRTGKVRALRDFRLNKKVTEALIDGVNYQIQAQKEGNFDSKAYDQRVKMLMVKGPERVSRNMVAGGVVKTTNKHK